MDYKDHKKIIEVIDKINETIDYFTGRPSNHPFMFASKMNINGYGCDASTKKEILQIMSKDFLSEMEQLTTEEEKRSKENKKYMNLMTALMDLFED